MLRGNEHSLPTAGWNVVLLQLFCDTVLQDKCLLTVFMFMFICLNWIVNHCYSLCIMLRNYKLNSIVMCFNEWSNVTLMYMFTVFMVM